MSINDKGDEAKGNALSKLDVQAEGNDEHTVVNQVLETYNETIKKGNDSITGRPFYKNGLMQEIVMPADASAALIEGSGTYMMHLAFYLSIQFFVEYTSDEFFCYEQLADLSWNRTDQRTSFLNESLTELKFMHLACFVLLLSSKLYYFSNVGRFTLDQ
jgi:hypothetical protein